MNRQSQIPNQEELEEMLRQVQPTPSQHFYHKMADQPWTKSARFHLRYWLSQPRPASVIVFSLILLLSLILVAPSVDVLASRIAQFFTSSAGDTVAIDLPLLDFPDTEGRFSISISEAVEQAGFPIKMPEILPEAYTFSGAKFTLLRNSVGLIYESRDGSIIRITQRPASLEYQSISVNAKVEKVKIGELVGEYVSGGWRAAQPEEHPSNLTVTLQAYWDPDANIHFLRWKEEDILYEILFSGSNQDSDQNLDKNDLIEIAENLKY